MSQMAKLNLKSVERVAPEDPVQARRRKLIAALDELQRDDQDETRATIRMRTLRGGNVGRA